MKTSNILIAFLSILVAFLLLRNCDRKQTERVEIVKFDTIEVIKPIERIVVRKGKPKIKYIYDTIIVSQPFVAQHGQCLFSF
jgi:hypothetical protein